MCSVTVEVDQEILRGFNPALDSTVAIRRWVQQLIDMRIHEMELEDTETMSIEEAREMTLAAVREEHNTGTVLLLSEQR
jgi:KaiC/GvpD/RAD55 family RecA-like ATPase